MALAKVSKLTLIDSSEKAIKVIQQQGRYPSQPIWIPKSMIEYQRKYAKNANGTQEIYVEIPEWLAESNNLEFD